MRKMNGLKLAKDLNKILEEIEAISNSYKGEELSDVDSKTMDRLVTKVYIIKKALEDNGLYEVFQDYVKALEDIQVISDKIEFGVSKFRPAFYTAMELAEDRRRKAEGYLMDKHILVNLEELMIC